MEIKQILQPGLTDEQLLENVTTLLVDFDVKNSHFKINPTLLTETLIEVSRRLTKKMKEDDKKHKVGL